MKGVSTRRGSGALRQIDASQEASLEVEYNSGGAWFDGVRVGSAVDAAEVTNQDDLVRHEGKEGRPWVNAKVLAGLMKVPRAQVVKVLAEQKR